VDKFLPESLIAEYGKNITHYAELNGQFAADGLSKDLNRIDEARDAAFKVVRQALNAMRQSLDDEVVTYHEAHIRPLFAAFWDFSTRMDYATETTYLRSFCQKLKALDFAILEKAFVSERQVQNLSDLNDRFEAVYVERNIKRSKVEYPAALAQAMQEQWNLIATFIMVKANEPATDENRETVDLFALVSAVLNEHIDYYRRNHISRKK